MSGMGGVLLVDVDAGGGVQVMSSRGAEHPVPVGDSADLRWPLEPAELDELRWYLELYLGSPYGVYEQRGSRVAQALGEWGQRVFDAVFGAGPARDALVALRARAGPVEVVFRSASPGVLGLPWELMHDPAAASPLVLDGVSISRGLLSTGTGPSFAVGGERLRVLMVISRPAGASDVAYQMIARPLVTRLSAVRGPVDLVVLRPPTLEALRAELARAAETGEAYQVVHFDGHGSLDQTTGPAPGAGMFRDGSPTGRLVFEKPTGGPDPVEASVIAQVLAAAEVPVVVLNACQSGAVGKELEAAVATRLLGQGAQAVVAMAYSVYATAAAEFMTAFYERLFAGDNISDAVAAGRAQMASRNLRHSPKGPLPLQDWLIPVHYKRSDVSFPQLKTTQHPSATLDELLDHAQQASTSDAGHQRVDPLAATGPFVGRDDVFYRVEAGLQHRRGVLLHGPGGTGKTEIAKAFGRWSAATGGVEQPGWVIWHSFEPGVATFGLDGVIDTVGGFLFDTQFHNLAPEQRQALVTQALAQHRVLLIFDNFESVHSMPDPDQATPPLPEPEKQRLVTFLDQVTTGQGKSMVILTSRTREDWLGQHPVPIDVGGLTPNEAIEYADHLLAPLTIPSAHRTSRDFADLLSWFEGHPLSMRLTLPHLTTHTPQDILDGLAGHTDLLDHSDTDPGTRATSLPASIAYSYRHLPEATQQLLPAVALFQGVTDKDVLGLFSSADGVPDRYAHTTTTQWETALDQATTVGLLTALGGGMYRIHPALPAYLTTLWHNNNGTGSSESYVAERHAADTALLRAYAALGSWVTQQINSGQATTAFAVVTAQKPTLNRMLALALDDQDFAPAQKILQPLSTHADTRGARQEQDAWADQVLQATETAAGTPPDLNTPAGALWLYTTVGQANRLHQAGRLDAAQKTYSKLRDMLQTQPATDQTQGHLATTHHQLGMVAQHRGDLDQAEDWYRQSLTIEEQLNNRPGMATSYHQLGIVAQLRGDLDQAEDWYRQSLTIKEQLDNRPGMASSYHQLGMVAQDRGDLDQAEDWYRQSLTIKEQLNNRPGMASSYHQLGIVAQLRGDLDQAEDWYRQSLTIKEQLDNRPGMASSYHQLGMVAQDRGDLDQAEDWYRQSLTIKEQLNDRPGMASSYHQLGIVAQLRGDLDQAEDWYRQSLTINEQLNNRPGMASSYHQLGIVAQHRGDLDQAEDWYRQSLTINEQLNNRPGVDRR